MQEIVSTETITPEQFARRFRKTRWARAATLTGDPHGRHAPRGRRGPAARSAPCERGRSGARERPTSPPAKPQ